MLFSKKTTYARRAKIRILVILLFLYLIPNLAPLGTFIHVSIHFQNYFSHQPYTPISTMIQMLVPFSTFCTCMVRYSKTTSISQRYTPIMIATPEFRNIILFVQFMKCLPFITLGTLVILFIQKQFHHNSNLYQIFYHLILISTNFHNNMHHTI